MPVSIEATRHYYRGRVYEAVGELELAIEEYRKAIEYGLDYADVHNSLGRVLAKKGFLEEARIEFEQALRLNPRYVEARRNLEELLTKISLLKPKIEQEKKVVTEETETVERVPSSIQEQSLEYPVLLREKKTSFWKYGMYITPFIVVILLSILFVPKIILKKTLPLQRVLNVEQNNISSIARYKKYFVISDWVNQEIVVYKILQNKINKVYTYSLAKDNIVPAAISFYNKSLLVLDSWAKKVYQFMFSDHSLVLTKIYDLKDIVPSGICVYKNYFLISDFVEQKIVVYNKNFVKLSVIDLPIKDIINIFSYKDRIWLVDKNFYLYELHGYNEIKNSYPINRLTDKTISAVFVDDKFLWISEEGQNRILYFPKNILY